MKSKPDKYRIKFFLCVEVKSKYVLTFYPYLGRQGAEDRHGDKIADYVVKKLLDPFTNNGFNVCTDNFFTSTSLANYLVSKGTTIVGTVKFNARFISDCFRQKSNLYESQFFSLESSKVLAVAYQCKKNKKVILLSTMHKQPIVTEGEKKKPEIINYYNWNKVGVDCLDQKLRLYSTKATTRRWPMAVFYDLLDKAANNAHIIYKEVTKSSISRRNFIIELAKELSKETCDQT